MNLEGKKAPAFSLFAVRKIARAVSYAMPRTLIAGTVKPCISPRPRAMYRSWIDAGRTPTFCPSSHRSQRASSFCSSAPKTAARATASIASEASRASEPIWSDPSFMATSPWNSDSNWSSMNPALAALAAQDRGSGESPHTAT